MYYRIEINGKLGTWQQEWFDGLTITQGKAHTLIEGHVMDQAQLHGILNVIRDLNLEMISLTKLPEQPEANAPDNLIF